MAHSLSIHVTHISDPWLLKPPRNLYYIDGCAVAINVVQSFYTNNYGKPIVVAGQHTSVYQYKFLEWQHNQEATKIPAAASAAIQPAASRSSVNTAPLIARHVRLASFVMLASVTVRLRLDLACTSHSATYVETYGMSTTAQG
jgi:hypothetical protein